MKGPMGLVLGLRNREYKKYLKDLAAFMDRRDLVFTPELMDRPPGRRALVLSPHCDDDVIGLGGLMHRHALDGDAVTVVYFTGAASGAGPGLPCRQAEARRAAAVLGISDLIFLGRPEGSLRPSRALASRVEGIIREKAPGVIYLPWFLDNHVDHLAVNLIFQAACRKRPPACRVCAYEVWTPLMPNRIFDMTAYADLKKNALAQHASQLSDADYISTALALNRYRSLTRLKGQGYAEAFLLLEARAYLSLLAAWQPVSFIKRIYRKILSP